MKFRDFVYGTQLDEANVKIKDLKSYNDLYSKNKSSVCNASAVINSIVVFRKTPKSKKVIFDPILNHLVSNGVDINSSYLIVGGSALRQKSKGKNINIDGTNLSL